MEKDGLLKLLDLFGSFPLTIKSIITDRHTQIKSYFKNNWKDIRHQVDVWHVGKKYFKKVGKVWGKKECYELNGWIKSIVNHLWWCFVSCNVSVKELKEKWISILYHVRNKHRWEESEIYKCVHEKLPTEVLRLKKWLKEGTPAYIALEKVITAKNLLCDLKYFVDFNHTGQLKVYHSLYLKYCPKQLHFSYPGMVARSQLAVMDFNSGVHLTQATMKNNEPCYKIKSTT